MAKAGDKKEITYTGRGNEKKPKQSESDKANASLVTKARQCKCIAFEADQENRTKALDDIRFIHVPGEQYDKGQKDARGDRPCYEFNELRVKALRVINDMRANRPQGKVRAVEDGDKGTADTKEGLIRNIWSVSTGDSVTDYAADYQVSGGMGAWRVETYFDDDTAWTQDIRVRAFPNPFCVWGDPTSKDPLKLDARWWIVSEKMSKRAHDERWPDKAMVAIDDDQEFDDDDNDWWDSGDEGTVRVCEYWYKEPTTKYLALLSDGASIEVDKEGNPVGDGLIPQGVTVVRKRAVKSHKIMSCIVSGNAVLEPPTEWLGKYFPFVQVYGEWRVIDGKVTWHGLPRFSKDAQRLTNVTMTAIAESVMSAPLSHFWATPKQAEGHLDKWKEAHKKLIPYLPYNPDAEAPGPPTRMGAADVPVALMEMRGIAADLLKGTTGIFDASIGQQSNETSGRAINARTRQGEIATFNFSDNMAKGVQHTWRIIDDLIPKIYTGERAVRILGVDGAEKYVKLNSVVQGKDGTYKKENDLSKGKFDVTYTVGPSFSTQRQEATELYSQLGQAVPAVWTVAGDLIFKSMDLPYAEQIAERLRTLLPPAIQKQMSEGKELPPEAQAAMAQAEQAMQQVQQMAQQLQEAQGKFAGEQNDAVKASAKAQVDTANLRAAEAHFAKDVADFKTLVAERALEQAGTDQAGALKQMLADGLASIQETATGLFGQYAEQLQATHAQAVASTAATPRRRRVKLTRSPTGGFEGEVTDDAEIVPKAAA